MLPATRHFPFRQARCCLTPSQTFHRQHQSAFVRILSSLAVLEQREGKLQTASLSAVTAAQKLGGTITGFVAGSQVRSVAEEAAKIKGIEKIIMVENGMYEKVCFYTLSGSDHAWLLLNLCQALPENYAPLLAENIKKGGYTHILAGHSAFGKNLMPRLSALLDIQQISDITAIEDENSEIGQSSWP